MAYSLAGFNGQRPDPVSGHYHPGNGYRACSPALGRFTAPDSWSPFGAGGINPYAYCIGDPVNRADPSGHFSLGQGIGMALGFVAGIALSILTEGAAMPVALTLMATVAGDAAIGAGAELATEAIDGQRINWGQVGLAAGMSAGATLAGFGLGRLSKLKGTSSRPFGGLMLEEGGATGTAHGNVSFFRVDVAPPSVVLKEGLSGNNTPRIVKLYGDDTIFAARTLEGIDAFRAEISSGKIFKFAARKHYYQHVIENGYAVERPKALHLYKITLNSSHSYEVLSDFLKEESNIHAAFQSAYKNASESEMANIETYKEALMAYSVNYNQTQEVQIRGPLNPENIAHITPQEEIFIRGQRT